MAQLWKFVTEQRPEINLLRQNKKPTVVGFAVWLILLANSTTSASLISGLITWSGSEVNEPSSLSASNDTNALDVQQLQQLQGYGTSWFFANWDHWPGYAVWRGYQRVSVNKDVTVVNELTRATTRSRKSKTVNNVIQTLKRSMKLKPAVPSLTLVACTNKLRVFFTKSVREQDFCFFQLVQAVFWQFYLFVKWPGT